MDWNNRQRRTAEIPSPSSVYIQLLSRGRPTNGEESFTALVILNKRLPPRQAHDVPLALLSNLEGQPMLSHGNI
ncbi:hypothetical protein VCV18_006339 [Metarhizium anisopliae]